jgi:hypothetical protein
MKNTIGDLRNHLFAAIEGLNDKEKPLDIDRAKAIGFVAQKIIETAKVEIQFLEVTGALPAGNFFPVDEATRADRTRRELNALGPKNGNRNLA